MQVKIFESSDMASGLKMIKKELGPDALILSTKTIRSGKLGLLGKPRLEITAAIDKPWPDKTFYLTPRADKKQNCTVLEKKSNQDVSPPREKKDEFPTYNSALHLQHNLVTETSKPSQPVPSSPEENDLQTEVDLHTEVDELKEMIRNLAQEMIRLNNNKPTSASSLNSDPHSSFAQFSPEQSSGLHSLYERLLDYGIGTETAKDMCDNAGENLTHEELSDLFKQQQYINNAISERLQVSTDFFPAHKRQHRLALVGPTGVGKTTTLAKIAANYLSKHSSSIALITIDTYRIAAVEQLKVYGEIMNLPVEVVLNPEQLEQMLLKHRDKELILIDTAGRSPQDSLCIEELASFLTPDLDIQKHLVLSATTRENELFEAMNRFSILDIDNTIITKIDECSRLGLLLDIQIQEKVPFSYITNGQRVPEDILEANKALLTQLIMTPAKGLSYE